MSYSDVINPNTSSAVVVGRRESLQGNTPRGVLQPETYINKNYDPITEVRSGPVFTSEDDKATYTYTITLRDDAVESLQQHLRNKVDEVLESNLQILKVGYAPSEVESWPQQAAEALAYSADNTADTPLIDSMASEDETKAELVGYILAKADAFATYTGQLLSRSRKLNRMIDAAILDESDVELPVEDALAALRIIEADEITTGWV